jgi:glycosyltransferase involved in cell wall biosynthesis
MGAKRILLLLPEAFEGAGGIQMFCRSLCLAAGRWAERNGASVSAIVLNDAARPDPRYVNGGFNSYVRVGRSKAKFIASYLRLLATCRPDAIIVGHVSLAPLALLPAWLGRPIRFCIAAYGIEVWRPLTRAEVRAMQAAQAVLAISDYTRDELLKHNRLDPQKISLFPCSLDPCWTADAQPPETAADPPMLLTVARLESDDDYKGIDSVIRSLPAVVREFGPVDYRIVGDGNDLPRLKALVEQCGVSRYVTFTGRVSEAELRQYYRRCSLFVMPSEREGFGIVFLEAMAYAKPVIGGAHGGTPSVVTHGETGLLVHRLDIEGLTQAMLRMLKNDELRADFGRAGHHRLLETFTFKNFEANFNEFMETSLSARSQSD